MKKITDFNVENKTIILRCDFNVTIKDGKIISDERIISSLPTIKYLINNHAKVIIMSHLGKIKSKEDLKDNSLFIVYTRLCELLKNKIIFSSTTRGSILEDKINSLKPGEILLMENTRYEDLDGKKESNCDDELSRYWASLGDFFINDAFAMTHRKHASNYGISKYIPSGIGFLIESELKGLELIINPIRPFTIFMGGAKVEDKLDYINKLLPKCDCLLLGGGIANSFLNTKFNVGASLYNNEKKDELASLLNEYNNKIVLPLDFKVKNNNAIVVKDIDEIEDNDIILDLGPKTLSIYKEKISNSKTIFLNGTAGKYEEKGFEDGTKTILESISQSDANTVIGGGDAIASSEYFKIKDFNFISTGGGATLSYLSEGKMLCMEDNEIK